LLALGYWYPEGKVSTLLMCACIIEKIIWKTLALRLFVFFCLG